LSLLGRIGARAIRASTLVDRAFGRFDRLRSRIIVQIGGDRLFEAYNDIAYGVTPEYLAGGPKFRRELFRWEEEIVARWFPPPPARVLVGGAGGGREVLRLAERGYVVVGFEPSPALARSLARDPAAARVETYLGRYETLPIVHRLDDGAPRDLTGPPHFDAGIFGWASYAHVRTDARRVAAVRHMAALCRGPIVISFYPARPDDRRRDAFSVTIGVYHLTDEAEIRQVAAAAGVDVLELSMDARDGRWPFAVLRSRGPSPPA
jgi:hypothetical protein